MCSIYEAFILAITASDFCKRSSVHFPVAIIISSRIIRLTQCISVVKCHNKSEPTPVWFQGLIFWCARWALSWLCERGLFHFLHLGLQMAAQNASGESRRLVTGEVYLQWGADMIWQRGGRDFGTHSFLKVACLGSDARQMFKKYLSKIPSSGQHQF